ncbi:serine hydrolase [Actinopolymorpha sp. B11F2]|uniref:serine hydrolase n=1 Tax=Actinopolymorpha sp. B11F2 TaxID=3160862 RepID=UPI0032E47105
MTVRQPAYVASSPKLLPLAQSVATDWQRLGVQGHLLARNISTGDQFGFDVDTPLPMASVVKVPLALAVLQRTATGALDAARQITIDPGAASFGPTGIAAYRHPVTIAVGDLVYQMLSVSDNAAADTLVDLVGVDGVQQSLREWGCTDIKIRHRMQRMYDCAAGVAGNDFGLAMELAIKSESTGHHVIELLDPGRGNVASAEALVDLLQRVWLDQIAVPAATAELRRLMSLQVFTYRLSSDLRTDTLRVSGKTGSFLHLRHEIGVVEAESGDRVAIAALTRSTRRAMIAHDVDLAIGAAARSAFEALRR